MNYVEHYFENLLYHDKDVKGKPNKKALSKAEQEAVEACYVYVIYNLFGSRELFEKFMNEGRKI